MYAFHITGLNSIKSINVYNGLINEFLFKQLLYRSIVLSVPIFPPPTVMLQDALIKLAPTITLIVYASRL